MNQQLLVVSVRIIHSFDCECANVLFGSIVLVSHKSLLLLCVQDTHLKRKLVCEIILSHFEMNQIVIGGALWGVKNTNVLVSEN